MGFCSWGAISRPLFLNLFVHVWFTKIRSLVLACCSDFNLTLFASVDWLCDLFRCLISFIHFWTEMNNWISGSFTNFEYTRSFPQTNNSINHPMHIAGCWLTILSQVWTREFCFVTHSVIKSPRVKVIYTTKIQNYTSNNGLSQTNTNQKWWFSANSFLFSGYSICYFSCGCTIKEVYETRNFVLWKIICW